MIIQSHKIEKSVLKILIIDYTFSFKLLIDSIIEASSITVSISSDIFFLSKKNFNCILFQSFKSYVSCDNHFDFKNYKLLLKFFYTIMQYRKVKMRKKLS